jgi:4-amino-4-deoxy-L-arabinose transferase-like glycosyltransferase
VERFDVLELRPHAPFYPVYIAAAKLLAGLGASPHLALAVVSATAGAALVTLTALLAFELLGRRAAVLAGALALASPFLWLTSEKLLSDMAGAAALTLGLWLLARARRRGEDAERLRTTAMVIFGVGLGIRLSYFPFAIAGAALVARAEGGGRAYAARARDLATGVTLWLVPLVIAAGSRPLVAVTWIQGVGHFTRWGGTALTVSSPFARLYGIAWGIWANLLGGAWLDAPASRWIGAPLLALLLVFAARRARGGRSPAIPPEIALAALAYFLWAALGQNTAHKPRHWLPLSPLLIVALAAGAEALDARKKRLGSAAVAILAAQWFTDGATLAAAHRAPSPAAALVRAVAAETGRDPRPIITRELARLLRESAPERRVIPVTGDADLLDAVAESGPEGALITGEALSPEVIRALEGRGLALTLAFARPRSRYVDSLWNELGLFAARPRP